MDWKKSGLEARNDESEAYNGHLRKIIIGRRSPAALPQKRIKTRNYRPSRKQLSVFRTIGAHQSKDAP